MGYHKRDIPRGQYGEISKIMEEAEEVLDALEQENKLMILLELSDMIGAIEGYLKLHQPNVTLNDLIIMKEATERAFKSGKRK